MSKVLNGFAPGMDLLASKHLDAVNQGVRDGLQIRSVGS
jgi:hypothetical protein